MFVFISGLNQRKQSEKSEEIMKVIVSLQTEVHVALEFTSGMCVWDARVWDMYVMETAVAYGGS